MMRQIFSQERGQSLVEFALVAMLLLSLVGGVVDFGGAFHHYIIITNAAREGARYGSRLPCKSDNHAALKTAIVNAAINEAAGSGVTLATSDIAITPDPVATGCAATGAELEVAVSFDYDLMLGAFMGVGDFTMTNSVRMVYFGNDQE